MVEQEKEVEEQGKKVVRQGKEVEEQVMSWLSSGRRGKSGEGGNVGGKEQGKEMEKQHAVFSLWSSLRTPFSPHSPSKWPK